MAIFSDVIRIDTLVPLLNTRMQSFIDMSHICITRFH